MLLSKRAPLPLSLFFVLLQASLGFPVEENERYDFQCPHGYPPPAIRDPGHDITKVHPAHIQYVAAIGDSITAGFASETLPLEFRRFSFSGGLGRDDQHTLQWLLSHYRNDTFGGSEGIHPPALPQDDDPYRYGQTDHFNVAVSGSHTDQYPMQLERLKNQTANTTDGWMMVTIFFGENDLCDHPESCGTPDQQESIVDRFEAHLEALLTDLIAWRPKLYINLMQLFWMSSVAKTQSWRCRAQAQHFHVCNCMHQGPDKAKQLDLTTDRMNAVIDNLAAKYDRIRPDIGINVVQTFNREPVPDLSYLSRLDCFHPSAKTHQLTAHSLWNAMLRPSQPTPMSHTDAFVPLCPNATSRVLTWRDQPVELQMEKEQTEKDNALRGPDYALDSREIKH